VGRLSGVVTAQVVKSTAKIDNNNQCRAVEVGGNGTLYRAMRIGGGACSWTGSQVEIDPGLRGIQRIRPM
jgi:hypothetical protein